VEARVTPASATTAGLTFEALYHPELLHRVNPRGDVGVITLWSPFRTAKRKLDAISPELLDRERSRVAVVANLYGDGLYAMLCNLLFNPQVRHLVAVGEDLGLATCAEIEAFLENGLEDAQMLGARLRRIRGTQRLVPAIDEFDEARLRATLTFRYLGKLSTPDLPEELTSHLAGLTPTPPPEEADRIRVEIPTTVPEDYEYRPSELTAHQVTRPRPLDCWEELVVRGMRFGRPVTVAGGPRLELLNAKAVITDPVDEPAEVLRRYGFDRDRFVEYQAKMLEPELPADIAYTYGNRLRGYFDQGASGRDTLQTVIDTLRANPESRRAYISLWDTSADLAAPNPGSEPARPCLTTLAFRRTDGNLALSATYRLHNLLTAWLENVYGLMAIQRHVAHATGMGIGPITVVSNSLGIDPRSPRYEFARALAENWKRDDDLDRETGKYTLREDPNGYFVVTVDEGEGCIVAEHRFGGLLIKQYRSDRADAITREVSADMAISLVSHALWLGRELARNEALLRGRAGAPADEAEEGP
jgi:hypothetical protein